MCVSLRSGAHELTYAVVDVVQGQRSVAIVAFGTLFAVLALGVVHASFADASSVPRIIDTAESVLVTFTS